jgi:hypothetical protein
LRTPELSVVPKNGMIDELETIWKEVVVAYSIYYPGILLKFWKITTKSAVRTAGVSAEIRTDYLPNTNRERYRYASPIDRYSFSSRHVFI